MFLNTEGTPGNRSSLFVITEILQYTVDKSRIEIYLGRNSGGSRFAEDETGEGRAADGEKTAEGERAERKKEGAGGAFSAFGRSASSLCSPFISEFCHVVQPTYI